MRIKWLRRAARSLAAEADFIAKDNPIAADRMVVRVRAAVDHLLDHPAMGRAGRDPNTRELVISGTPYIVAYRARGDMVEALHVLHAASRWPERF
ncbi:MAG: type II toxin-antitoxin system RelE/ParE family toxin [Pseudomonadota bacterium]|nr:type II toxin-antitoxin system RelE/ParE family toxin [Gammaproteobacteria bacterium]MDQ3580209.1 type II toxin-antitoxin system RelE/ParE family toxin [Pseudomonadota bacterium]